jgi:hypothetical protein
MDKGTSLLLLTFERPYTCFLVASVAVTVVRAALWSWRLFLVVPRRLIGLDQVLQGLVTPEDLAQAALANRISHELPSYGRLVQLGASSRTNLDAALRTLRATDVRFDYLWRRLAIGVSSTRGLLHLTLIAMALITAYGCFPNFEYFVVDGVRNASAARLTALYEAGKWVLVRLGLGLCVAAALAVVASAFDRLLQHRLASWKYIYATTRDALSDEPPK